VLSRPGVDRRSPTTSSVAGPSAGGGLGGSARPGPEGFEELLRAEVAGVVQRKLDAAITVVGDGEYGRAMSSPVDYGA
jgi:hypothetical protein